jgi:hypothetical protein
MTGRPLSLHNTSYQTHGPPRNGRFLGFPAIPRVALLALPLAVMACRPGSPEAPPGAPAGTGTPGTGSAVGPGGATGAVAAPAPQEPMPVLFAVARSGDTVTPLDAAGIQAPGPAPSFEVRAGAVLTAARLVLLDGQDQLVAGSGDAEFGTDSRFTFTPASPLRPGATYLLRLEGITGPAVSAPDGRTFLPAAFPVQVPGAPARPSGGRRR